MLPQIVAGAVITEQVFNWPGMGKLAVRAAEDRDPSLMMGVILLVGPAVLIGSLVADIGYALADPRVRLSKPGR
jgi:peptide/nickel transport system permease protein